MLGDFVSDMRAAGNERGYNEVVLSFDVWRAQLPNTIEAVFYPTSGRCVGYDDCEGRTRRVHAALEQAFPDSHVPLLTLDPMNWLQPFTPAHDTPPGWRFAPGSGR